MGFMYSSVIHLLLLTYLLSPYYVQVSVLVIGGITNTVFVLTTFVV